MVKMLVLGIFCCFLELMEALRSISSMLDSPQVSTFAVTSNGYEARGGANFAAFVNQSSCTGISFFGEISVLVELILGHLRYLLTDVPPQPNSPPDYVFRLSQGNKISF